MIRRGGKLLILIYMIFLAVLFLMCFTDLIIREPEKEIYQIAVIIEDVRDDNYGNFRKGMDQAAIEFNADVHFITLYERLDAEQQMELISREQQDGADALIVVPVDEERLMDAVSEKQIAIPMVVLGTASAEEGTAGRILIDYREMGEKLAERMKERMPENCQILLLGEADGRSRITDSFLDGAMTKLEHDGYSCLAAEPAEGEGVREIFGELSEKETVILAGSPEILSEAAEILAADPVLSDRVQGLYGRGSTLSILDDLDEGLITGVCVTDEFSRGYFSVYMAIQALEEKDSQRPMTMDSYYIEKRDLREPKYEKILFPVE